MLVPVHVTPGWQAHHGAPRSSAVARAGTGTVRLGRSGLVRAPSGVLVELERVGEVLVVHVAVLEDEGDGGAARRRRGLEIGLRTGGSNAEK